MNWFCRELRLREHKEGRAIQFMDFFMRQNMILSKNGKILFMKVGSFDKKKGGEMMRYFKCNTLRQEDRKMIVQDVELSDKEKKEVRQGKLLNFVGILLFSMAFIAAFVGGLYLIVQIPTPQNPILFVLAVIVMLVLGIFALFASVLIGSFVSSSICKRAQEKLAVQKRICFDKALYPLRTFYGWAEPCMVTKCYDSSDKNFKNRDVCLFFQNDELRITADLKHGFSIRENDLGCYAFRLDEISLAQVQVEQFLMTEFQSGDTVFRLGRRAKRFIEKECFDKETIK